MALLPGPWRGDAIRDEAHHAAVTNAAAGDLGSRGVVICFAGVCMRNKLSFDLQLSARKAAIAERIAAHKIARSKVSVF